MVYLKHVVSPVEVVSIKIHIINGTVFMEFKEDKTSINLYFSSKEDLFENITVITLGYRLKQGIKNLIKKWRK